MTPADRRFSDRTSPRSTNAGPGHSQAKVCSAGANSVLRGQRRWGWPHVRVLVPLLFWPTLRPCAPVCLYITCPTSSTLFVCILRCHAPPPPFPSLCPPPPPPHSSRWAASFVHFLSNKRREGDASSGPALTGHRAVRHPFAGLSKGGMRAPIPWDRRLAPLQRRRPLPTATYRFITARFGLQPLFAPAQPVALGLCPPPPRALAGARATRADCLFSDGRFGGQGTQEV